MFTATPEPSLFAHAVAPATTSDLELTRRIRAGDHSAFQELLDLHQARIFRTLCGILQNRDDAEEIAQEAFMKAYLSIGTFDQRSSFFTWIYRIAVNEAYSHLRKQRVRRALEASTPGNVQAADVEFLGDGRPTAERTLAQRDFLNKLLAQIPDDDRVLILLKEVDGCSVPHLAQMTGMNENTIKVKLYRCRRRLVKLAARLSRPAARNQRSIQ